MWVIPNSITQYLRLRREYCLRDGMEISFFLGQGIWVCELMFKHCDRDSSGHEVKRIARAVGIAIILYFLKFDT